MEAQKPITVENKENNERELHPTNQKKTSNINKWKNYTLTI